MNNIITQFFTVDHQRLDQLFRAFQQYKNEDKALARQYFDKFKSGLYNHIQWEEELLFPEFEQATGMSQGGPTFVMRAEHQELKQLLEKIEWALEQSQDSQPCEYALEQLLDDHNEKEEHILYPNSDMRIPLDKVNRILLALG